MGKGLWPILVGSALLVLPAAAQSQTAAARERATIAERLDLLRKQEDRLVVIGERISIAAAAAGWCEGGFSLGWSLGDIGQYPKAARQAARTVWTVPTGATLYVAAVAPDGAAAQAGLTPGTGIVSIAGRTPMRNSYQSASNHARANSEELIARQLALGPLTIETLAGDGTRRTIELTARPACDTRFEMSAEDEEQAYADGAIVQVTAGMGRYTQESDQELAAVVAHELAHNILRHVMRTEQAGTPDNYTRYLGRYTNITRSMEEEADRMSVWLLALAGYEPSAPVDFWRRFGPNNDSAHPLGRTHDRWTDRVAAITNELETMNAAKQADPQARPGLLDRRDAVPVPGQRAVLARDEQAPAP